MADKAPTPTAVDAEKQQNDSGWPVPGDEGFVHPDGTKQASSQLEDNRQAQADRDHVGAVAHGAPLATPGPQAAAITADKVEQASKVDTADGEGNWVDKSLAETAAAQSDPQPAASESGKSGK